MSGAVKLLESSGAEIAQGRMPPLTVVPEFNVVEDCLASCGARRKGAVGTFGFEGALETLLQSIVKTATDSAHAQSDMIFLQQAQVIVAGVLATLVGMM